MICFILEFLKIDKKIKIATNLVVHANNFRVSLCHLLRVLSAFRSLRNCCCWYYYRMTVDAHGPLVLVPYY